MEKKIDANFLAHTLLFQGIGAEEISLMLGCLRAEEKTCKKGDIIYRVGDRVKAVGLLLSGALSIENDDLCGNKTVLTIVKPGEMFAETYACIPGEQLMISVVALSDATVLYLDMEYLLQVCDKNCAHHSKLIRNLLTIAAKKNLMLSRRSLHTASKSIRGRLLSYLSYEATKNGNYTFDIPYNRQQLADYLGIDRSALSNELSKMRKEGLLSVDHSHFAISKDCLRDYSWAEKTK